MFYANWDQLELIWPLDERPEGILNIWIYDVPLGALLGVGMFFFFVKRSKRKIFHFIFLGGGGADIFYELVGNLPITYRKPHCEREPYRFSG